MYISKWFLNEGRVVMSNVVTIISRDQNSNKVFSSVDKCPLLPMAYTPLVSEESPANLQYSTRVSVCACMHEWP